MPRHDRLFKELLTTFFAEFIDLFLPQVAAYLDVDSLIFLDKEVFTDVTAGERHEADLVVRARFKGTDSFFLVHVETQAQAQKDFGARMFHYFARLHEKYAQPVYPIVVFSFDAPRKRQSSSYEISFPDLQVLSFRYQVIQLNRLSWRDFVARPNPVGAALMAKMNIAPEDRWRVRAECMQLLVTLQLDRAKMRLISGFIDTYLQLTAEEMKLYEAEIRKLAEPEREAIMEIMTSWKKEGIEQGIQQGRQEGRREEAASLVIRQIERRFGLLAAPVQDRIRSLSLERLEDLGEALLDFRGAEDLMGWLSRHEK